MTHTASYTKRLPAPSIRKLLRETGWTQAEVAHRHGCQQSFVSRVIAKQFASDPLWTTIAWCLNHPLKGGIDGR
jgi:hypothetical protein